MFVFESTVSPLNRFLKLPGSDGTQADELRDLGLGGCLHGFEHLGGNPAGRRVLQLRGDVFEPSR